mgnify:CR=1 FL=1
MAHMGWVPTSPAITLLLLPAFESLFGASKTEKSDVKEWHSHFYSRFLSSTGIRPNDLTASQHLIFFFIGMNLSLRLDACYLPKQERKKAPTSSFLY